LTIKRQCNFKEQFFLAEIKRGLKVYDLIGAFEIRRVSE